MQTSFEPIGAFIGAGDVTYSPQLDCSGNFGAWEVHPNKVKITRGNTVSLEWNGEYLAVGFLESDDGSEVIPYSLGCCGVKPNLSAKEAAEMVCALRNDNKPTRVVDAFGGEYVSRHTKNSVTQALAVAQEI